MNYLISLFDCNVLADNKYFSLIKNVKYVLNNVFNFDIIVFGNNNEIPVYINLEKENSRLIKCCCGTSNYYILLPYHILPTTHFVIKHLNTEYYIDLSTNLSINTQGENLLNIKVGELEFSHYENFGNFLLLHFLGKRNLVVCIQNKKVNFASFYDEYNSSDTEKLFLCRQRDSLNHGKVFKINKTQTESYLVYLDDNDMCLKPELVACAFLDCLLADNYKYCNLLLSNELQQKNPQDIKLFFCEFDFVLNVEKDIFILLNKNALAGIYKFEIVEKNITNIIHLG